MSLVLHPAAAIFPRMSEAEFAALREDIREHGVRQPVLVYRGEVLDGRHRLEACRELDIECPAVEWDGSGSVVDVLVSLNLKRRHLSPSQAAIAAARALPFYEAEAKQRQLSQLKQGTARPVPAEIPEREKGDARDHAARAFGTSPRYVSDAKRLLDEAPEQAQAVERGEVTLSKVKSAEKRTARTQAIVRQAAGARALGELRPSPVIYADPAWRYEFTRSETRAIENQYPTMSQEEIAGLSVPATDDAVLFLWATSPKLLEALAVLEAWGFEYRSSLVWVKDRIGMGYYARQRHEWLLVGTRGELPVPAAENRPDSVIEAPREDHSEKPEAVYERIERMYPEYEGLWLELFQRRPRPGWQGWGFEA